MMDKVPSQQSGQPIDPTRSPLLSSKPGNKHARIAKQRLDQSSSISQTRSSLKASNIKRKQKTRSSMIFSESIGGSKNKEALQNAYNQIESTIPQDLLNSDYALYDALTGLRNNCSSGKLKLKDLEQIQDRLSVFNDFYTEVEGRISNRESFPDSVNITYEILKSYIETDFRGIILSEISNQKADVKENLFITKKETREARLGLLRDWDKAEKQASDIEKQILEVNQKLRSFRHSILDKPSSSAKTGMNDNALELKDLKQRKSQLNKLSNEYNQAQKKVDTLKISVAKSHSKLKDFIEDRSSTLDNLTEQLNSLVNSIPDISEKVEVTQFVVEPEIIETPVLSQEELSQMLRASQLATSISGSDQTANVTQNLEKHLSSNKDIDPNDLSGLKNSYYIQINEAISSIDKQIVRCEELLDHQFCSGVLSSQVLNIKDALQRYGQDLKNPSSQTSMNLAPFDSLKKQLENIKSTVNANSINHQELKQNFSEVQLGLMHHMASIESSEEMSESEDAELIIGQIDSTTIYSRLDNYLERLSSADDAQSLALLSNELEHLSDFITSMIQTSENEILFANQNYSSLLDFIDSFDFQLNIPFNYQNELSDKYNQLKDNLLSQREELEKTSPLSKKAALLSDQIIGTSDQLNNLFQDLSDKLNADIQHTLSLLDSDLSSFANQQNLTDIKEQVKLLGSKELDRKTLFQSLSDLREFALSEVKSAQNIRTENLQLQEMSKLTSNLSSALEHLNNFNTEQLNRYISPKLQQQLNQVKSLTDELRNSTSIIKRDAVCKCLDQIFQINEQINAELNQSVTTVISNLSSFDLSGLTKEEGENLQAMAQNLQTETETTHIPTKITELLEVLNDLKDKAANRNRILVESFKAFEEAQLISNLTTLDYAQKESLDKFELLLAQIETILNPNQWSAKTSDIKKSELNLQDLLVKAQEMTKNAQDITQILKAEIEANQEKYDISNTGILFQTINQLMLDESAILLPTLLEVIGVDTAEISEEEMSSIFMNWTWNFLKTFGENKQLNFIGCQIKYNTGVINNSANNLNNDKYIKSKDLDFLRKECSRIENRLLESIADMNTYVQFFYELEKSKIQGPITDEDKMSLSAISFKGINKRSNALKELSSDDLKSFFQDAKSDLKLLSSIASRSQINDAKQKQFNANNNALEKLDRVVILTEKNSSGFSEKHQSALGQHHSYMGKSDIEETTYRSFYNRYIDDPVQYDQIELAENYMQNSSRDLLSYMHSHYQSQIDQLTSGMTQQALLDDQVSPKELNTMKECLSRIDKSESLDVFSNSAILDDFETLVTIYNNIVERIKGNLNAIGSDLNKQVVELKQNVVEGYGNVDKGLEECHFTYDENATPEQNLVNLLNKRALFQKTSEAVLPYHNDYKKGYENLQALDSFKPTLFTSNSLAEKELDYEHTLNEHKKIFIYSSETETLKKDRNQYFDKIQVVKNELNKLTEEYKKDIDIQAKRYESLESFFDSAKTRIENLTNDPLISPFQDQLTQLQNDYNTYISKINDIITQGALNLDSSEEEILNIDNSFANRLSHLESSVNEIKSEIEKQFQNLNQSLEKLYGDIQTANNLLSSPESLEAVNQIEISLISINEQVNSSQNIYELDLSAHQQGVNALLAQIQDILSSFFKDANISVTSNIEVLSQFDTVISNMMSLKSAFESDDMNRTLDEHRYITGYQYGQKQYMNAIKEISMYSSPSDHNIKTRRYWNNENVYLMHMMGRDQDKDFGQVLYDLDTHGSNEEQVRAQGKQFQQFIDQMEQLVITLDPQDYPEGEVKEFRDLKTVFSLMLDAIFQEREFKNGFSSIEQVFPHFRSFDKYGFANIPKAPYGQGQYWYQSSKASSLSRKTLHWTPMKYTEWCMQCLEIITYNAYRYSVESTRKYQLKSLLEKMERSPEKYQDLLPRKQEIEAYYQRTLDHNKQMEEHRNKLLDPFRKSRRSGVDLTNTYKTYSFEDSIQHLSMIFEMIQDVPDFFDLKEALRRTI